MALGTTTTTIIAKAASTPTSTTTGVTKTPKLQEEKRLRDTVNPVTWTIVGLEDCPWTIKALELVKERGEVFKFIVVNREWQRRLQVEFNTRRTPGIFKGSMFFGGFDALEAYYKASFITDTETFE